MGVWEGAAGNIKLKAEMGRAQQAERPGMGRGMLRRGHDRPLLALRNLTGTLFRESLGETLQRNCLGNRL